MFDVGFSELTLIFGVSLLVLGPKRLPGLVSKVGRWVGKARSMARDFQQQLENEVNLEELNKITDQITRDAQSTRPAPPPELTGDASDTATPTYPYSAPDSPAAESPGTLETSSLDAQPTDDTYSHAHAAGDAPVQADLDLADDSRLPPDDARRNG